MTGRRPAPNPDMLSVRDVAGLLAVSKMTIHRLIRAGHLNAYRIGRAVRVHRSDLDEFLTRSTTGGVG